jgi:hypothetical protein
MSQFLCHDFKTPRTDMSRRLPGSMRLVPVLFYVVSLATAFFIFKDVRDLQEAEKQRIASVKELEELTMELTKLDEEKSKIDNELFRAQAVAKWVEGTRVLQPITVAIARAMPPETNITELSLERSPDLPAQISLLVRMINATVAEVPKIEGAVNRLHYRTHSGQQAKQGEQVEFRSMLVWQEQ